MEQNDYITAFELGDHCLITLYIGNLTNLKKFLSTTESKVSFFYDVIVSARENYLVPIDFALDRVHLFYSHDSFYNDFYEGTNSAIQHRKCLFQATNGIQ